MKGGIALITIDYSDRRPIYEQLTERIRNLILAGVFPQDTQLPSVRSLAVELSINPNTIQRAYAELERQGIIYCVKGKGNYVASTESLREQHKAELRQRVRALAEEAKKAGMTEEEWLSEMKGAWESV